MVTLTERPDLPGIDRAAAMQKPLFSREELETVCRFFNYSKALFGGNFEIDQAADESLDMDARWGAYASGLYLFRIAEEVCLDGGFRNLPKEGLFCRMAWMADHVKYMQYRAKAI